MKGIKFLIGALAAAGLLISVSAAAQENANRDADGNVVRGPYETNAFKDNWFVGGGIGFNDTWNWANGPALPFVKAPGLALDLYIGKWLTPDWGFRFRYSGLTNDVPYTTNPFTYPLFANPQNQWTADFLINISSLKDGYMESRSWTWVMYPFAGLEFYGAWNPIRCNHEWVLGLGSLVIWHPDWIENEKLSLTIDNRFGMTPDAAIAPNEGGLIDFPFALTLGVVYNISDKNNFDRHSSITPTIIPLPFTEDDYNELKDKVAALESENAALKDKIAAMEEYKEKNYTEGQTYIYKNGEFVATDVKAGAPVTLYFTIGKAELSDRELAHLEYFAANVLDADSKVTVTGSADKQTGTAKFNQKLSEDRANYVKKILIKKYGLKEENITVVANGDKNNVFDTPAKNRVVTITLD